MTALEGTLSTPLGKVQKKTALIVAGGVVGLGAIVWFRQKQQSGTEITSAEINPATGYPYGSAEDAAALASQAAYQSPPSGGGGNTGGAGGYPSNIGYATNGQWVQAVVEYMLTNGLVEEPSQLSSALGKYITGSPATETDVNLIQQAIAVQGFPPVSGPSGYPPAINRTPAPAQPAPAPTPTPTPTPTPVPTPKPPAPTPAPLPKRRYVITVRFTTNNPPWNSTLSGIVARVRLKLHISRSVGQLATWNNIANVNVIQPGRKIWIDPPGKYSGESRFNG